MSLALRAPLLPAALMVAAVAWMETQGALAAQALSLVAFVASLVLARASADRPRRLLWAATAIAAAVMAVRPLFGPAPAFDLAHAGPLDGVRAALASPLRRLVPEPEAGILLGIVLGERASVGADLAAAFARTGTTHLLAISGFNMTLVAASVALLLRQRVRPQAVAAATIVAIGAYSVLVGLAPSVLRAAVMGGVAAIGMVLGRRSAVANALCAAVAAMIAVSPDVLTDVGFELSVGATAGLLVFQPALARRLRPAPALVREGLAATLAASLPTVPIIVAVFGRLSLVSPIANVLAVPLFPPLMAAGALTSAVGLVSVDAARPFAAAAFAVAWSLRQVVETSAAVPGASLSVPDGPLAGVVAAGSIAAVLAARRRFAGPLRIAFGRLARRVGIRHAQPVLAGAGHLAGRRVLAAGALVVALAAGTATAAFGPFDARPPIRVLALDVGQGDAYLIEAGDHNALIDGGPDPSRLLAELGATLAPWDRRLDLVALTHAHADHGNGLLALFDRYDIGLAVEPVGLNDGALATAWAQQAARAGVPRRAVRAGAEIALGGARIRVLAPNDDPNIDVPSLVLRLDLGAFSMLFMGDATEQAQADLLLAPAGLASRVYVPPHHGAATPHDTALVGAVRPEAAVLSVGAGNRYGHPTPQTLAALSGIATYRTDEDGTVEVEPDGARLVARTHANGLPPPRRGSVPYPASPR